MSLYQRTVLIIFCTLVGLVAILYAASRFILLGSFRDLEQETVRQRTRRAVEVQQQQLDQLSRTAQDWATWDAAVQFMTDQEPRFVQENITPSTLANLDLDFILFLRPDGTLYFGRALASDATRQLVECPFSLTEPALLRRLALGEAAWNSQHTGLLVLKDVTVALAARPIVTSLGVGPVHGTLVMGRYIHAEELAHLNNVANAQVSILSVAPTATVPDDWRPLAAQVRDALDIATVPAEANLMRSVALLHDAFGEPHILLCCQAARELYHQGRSSLSYYVLSLLLAGLVFGLVFLILLDKLVLARLARLCDRVGEIAQSSDISARVALPGQDELGRLAGAINQMLDELERAQNQLRRAHGELEQRVEERTRELREAQQHVIEQERMRALGQMASGIAHDFNNALATILGSVELLQMQRADRQQQDNDDALLESIHTAAEDAANAVSRLREFYRYRDESEMLQNVNLNQVVEQVVSMTEPMWKDQALAKGRTITVVRQLQPVPLVAGNEAELREMLTNLIFNAVDALPKGGTITVSTEQTAEQVLVAVSDNGIGMTEEVRRRCLEPFFTTKGEKGTGLGLAMVHGTVRRHLGTLDIDSEVGRGTTMRVGLPIQTSHTATSVEERTEPPLAPLKILLADDVPSVRGVVRAYLTGDGHTVHEAKNGREGLALFYSDTYDLIITDRGMPDMSGDQLATEILQASPDTPLIMLTGFGEMMRSAGEKPAGVDLVVSKPVTVNQLRRAMREVLTARGRLPKA